MSWLALWAAATIPPTGVRFFRIFLAQPSIGGPKRGPRVTLAWTLLAYVGLIYAAIVGPSAGAATLTWPSGDTRLRQVYEEMWFAVPFCIYVFGGLYRGIFDMYMQYRATTKRVERKRVGYLALGGFVATTLALTSVLPGFAGEWPAVGNALRDPLPLLPLADAVPLPADRHQRAVRQDGGARHAGLADVGGLRLPVLLDRHPEGRLPDQRARRVVRHPDPVRAGAEPARGRRQPVAPAPAHGAARADRGGAPRAAGRRRRGRSGPADPDRARGVAPGDRRVDLLARRRRRRVRPRRPLRPGAAGAARRQRRARPARSRARRPPRQGADRARAGRARRRAGERVAARRAARAQDADRGAARRT